MDRARVWTAAEATRLLESASADDDALYAAKALLLVLGLRRGEVLGLAWQNVDFDNGHARIAWRLQRLPGNCAAPAPRPALSMPSYRCLTSA